MLGTRPRITTSKFARGCKKILCKASSDVDYMEIEDLSKVHRRCRNHTLWAFISIPPFWCYSVSFSTLLYRLNHSLCWMASRLTNFHCFNSDTLLLLLLLLQQRTMQLNQFAHRYRVNNILNEQDRMLHTGKIPVPITAMVCAPRCRYPKCCIHVN